MTLHLPKPLPRACQDPSFATKSQNDCSSQVTDPRPPAPEGGRKSYFPVHCRATNDELALFTQPEFCLHSFQTKPPLSTGRTLGGRKQNVGQEEGTAGSWSLTGIPQAHPTLQAHPTPSRRHIPPCRHIPPSRRHIPPCRDIPPHPAGISHPTQHIPPSTGQEQHRNSCILSVIH